MKKNNKNGFTLVELLAVIVILAIILVIAVPKVMSIIEDAKKGTLESTAKMIASQAEKQKVQNTVLGNDKEITCDSVAKINKGDYASCDITFEDNTAKVTIEGSGKFDGLWVCEGTKTNAEASNEECSSPLQVKHPLFLKGQELTLDKFEVTLTESNGSVRTLYNGGLKVDDSQITTISSPNWPENYPNNLTEEESYWEVTYDDADAIQITFDETTKFGVGEICEEYCEDNDVCYDECWDDEDRLEFKALESEYYISNYDIFSGKTYIIKGNYIKVYMSSRFSGKGFSAIIKPMYSVTAEYTVSPNVVPNTEGNFDITITVNGQNMSNKISTKAVHDVEDYISSLEPFENNIQQKTIRYNEIDYNAGIRYKTIYDNINRKMIEPNNKVYYNCDDKDGLGILYGEEGYNYATSCEVWRIIGVFDTKTSEGGSAVPRVKLVNTASTFKASWDSSSSRDNVGLGINQWGPSTHEDGSAYEGSDLMQLLNGYYIGKENSICTYCNESHQDVCEQTCTAESLKNANMKVLTNNAKNMVENAVWDTFAIHNDLLPLGDEIDVESVYLQEKGISEQYTGKRCDYEMYCTDKVIRTTGWTGLVGLLSVADFVYYDGSFDEISDSSWSISPIVIQEDPYKSGYVRSSSDVGYCDVRTQNLVFPSVYLKPGIKVISGNGDDKPYILAI